MHCIHDTNTHTMRIKLCAYTTTKQLYTILIKAFRHTITGSQIDENRITFLFPTKEKLQIPHFQLQPCINKKATKIILPHFPNQHSSIPSYTVIVKLGGTWVHLSP